MNDDEKVDELSRQAWRSIEDERSREGMVGFIGLVLAVASGVLTYQFFSTSPLHVTAAVLCGGVLGSVIGYRFYRLLQIVLGIGLIYALVHFFVSQPQI